MWRMMSRFMTNTLMATLAFAGFSALEAGAAAVQSYNYSTSGTIANQTGVAPIVINGINSQTMTMPGTFAIGQFDALNILPTSALLTYNNTPFTITMNVGNGTGFTTPYVVSGVLNGSITGSGISNMVATVSSITGGPAPGYSSPTSPPFPASDIQISAQTINAPNAYTGTDGITTLYATVSPQLLLAPVPAPEPASIAIFGAGLAAWGIQRRLSRSRRLSPKS